MLRNEITSLNTELVKLTETVMGNESENNLSKQWNEKDESNKEAYIESMNSRMSDLP